MVVGGVLPPGTEPSAKISTKVIQFFLFTSPQCTNGNSLESVDHITRHAS